MNITDDIYNLESIEIRKLIYKSNKWKYCKSADKKTETKYLTIISTKNSDSFTYENLFDFVQQISVIQKINHPSILKFIGFNPKNVKGSSKPTIVTEYCKYITNVNFTNKKLIILYGIASAMSYLHSHGILHRNLDIKNIYLDKLQHPKIWGFDYTVDISTNLINNQPRKFSNFKGNPKIQSPEVLIDLKYSKASDVYSFSLLMYEIITNKDPFDGCNDFAYFVNEVAKKGKRPEFQQNKSNCYTKLIEECWSQDPKLRPTFDDIVNQFRTNPEFILEDTDKEEFFKYIKYIDEFPITFETASKTQQIDDIIKSSIRKFDPSKIKSKSYKTDINLDDYEKVDFDNDYNLYKTKIYQEKETKIKVLASIYRTELSKFLRNEIINFCRMVNITAQLNHPSIVKFIGFNEDDFRHRKRPVILTEKVNSFSIRDIIEVDQNKIRYGYNGTKKLIIIYGIAAAMSYLHSHDIIHRDLKLENIHFNKVLIPKLAGFDIAKELKGKTFVKSEHIKGTAAYLAPEVYEKHEYSKYSDVYAFSYIIYELLTNEKGFDDKLSPNDIKHKIIDERTRPIIHPTIPNAYREMIERCWSQEPQNRPSFDDIISQLKTDSNFITEDIDEEEYYQYIQFIDKHPITFEPSRRIQQLDDIIEHQLENYHDICFPPYGNIYETQTCDISFNEEHIHSDNFSVENEISDGYYYSVDKVKEVKTGSFYAAKIFKNGAKSDITIQEVVNFSRETNIILQLNHPSIIKCYGYHNIDITKEESPTIYVEYASNDSLNKISQKTNPNWTKTKILINIYGIAAAMSYLHSHDIIHRDLKTSNVFLDESLYPKLSGFFLSKELKGKTFVKSEHIKGTAAYLAPEVYVKHEYSKYSDVYAFSYIIYELLTNEKGFDDKLSPNDIKRKIIDERTRPIIRPTIPNVYREMIERCWSQEPQNRPSFDDIISQLKTDSNFITEDIDEEEYYRYIQFIDKHPITFEPSRRIQQFEEYIKDKSWHFHELKNDVGLRNIYETEPVNISVDLNYINLNKYKKSKLIRKGADYKIYEIFNKETKIRYITKNTTEEDSPFLDFWLMSELSSYMNTISKLYHPSLLNLIGYSPFNFKDKPKPVIIMESISNGSLNKIFELNDENREKIGWNDTKKLINLFGIASAISYLHSKDIIYNYLKPLNIFLDDFLFPKISVISLGLYDHLFDKDDEYTSPEKLNDHKSTKCSDVYAFGIIAYKIITNQNIFQGISEFNFKELVYEQRKRPEFKVPIPECYQKLIEKCWSHDPNERPTFDEIVFQLKNNSEFITENINKDEYNNYIKFIEETKNITQYNQQIQQFTSSPQTSNLFRPIKIDFNELKVRPKLQFSVDLKPLKLENFSKKSKIGEGGFGVVYKTVDKMTGLECAAKISIYEIDQCPDDTIVNLTREIDIIARLNHPSILKFIGFSPKNFKNKSKPVILMEFATGGSLEDILNLERNSLGNHNWDDTKKLINIYGIASGMKYLHQHKILHRDLKPANILLDEYLFPKIADFGLSKDLNKKSENEIMLGMNSGFKGTYAYCSPEIMKNQKYTEAGDVFAFGMILYEIMTNEILYEGYNRYQIYRDILEKARPKIKKEYKIPYCYQNLIEKCWLENENKRPKFASIVDQLENNSDFITINVDKNEFLNYVSFLKDSLNEENKSIDQSNQQENKNESVFTKASNQNNRIQETEDIDDISSNSFLDISQFERKELINKGDITKLYEFMNKKTGEIFSGQMSIIKMKKFSDENISKLENEINIISKFDHPSILKFIGFSPFDFKKQRKPVIVTELSSKITLKDMLDIERNKRNSINEWNDTKKLINIYGIASGMSYYHSFGIIHRCLKPSSIFFDDCLFPKIGDFGLLNDFSNYDSMTNQSMTGVKANPIYLSPEVLQFNEYSKSSDVYAFSFIAYEIVTGKIPFEGLDSNQIFNEIVVKRKRPEIDQSIPSCYQKLIEDCWSHDPNDRPSFDEIVHRLEIDHEFIIDSVNDEDYKKYISFIQENEQDTSDSEDSYTSEETESDSNENDSNSVEDEEESKIEAEIQENEYDSLDEEDGEEEMNSLNIKENNNNISKDLRIQEKNADLLNYQGTESDSDVNDSNSVEDEKETNTEAKIQENKYNILVKEKAPNSLNTKEDVSSIEFLAKKYSKENDSENTFKFMNMLINLGKCDVPLEYAVNLYKLKKFKQAYYYFNQISKLNNPIAIFFIGVMNFYGQACEKNQEHSYEIMKHLSKNGIDAATEFLENKF